MIRHAEPQNKTVGWAWQRDDPTGIGTRLDFEIEITPEREVKDVTLMFVVIGFDLPEHRFSTICIARERLSEHERMVAEYQGKKAYLASGHLDKLIW